MYLGFCIIQKGRIFGPLIFAFIANRIVTDGIMQIFLVKFEL